MKKLIALSVIIGLLFIGIIVWNALPGDRQNKIARLGIAYLNGDYKVTYAVDGYVKSWTIKNGKVTAVPEKGYYFFWVENETGDKKYAQSPIDRTIIEEL